MRTTRAPLLAAALSIAALAAGAAACDDLNKPAHVPKSEPRTSCFTDVECASNMKCEKGPDDITGRCVPPDAAQADGGAGEGEGEDAGPVMPPPVQAQPGDIKI